jgi:glycolate oxidase
MSLFHKDAFRELEKSLGKGKLFRSPEDLALYGMDATHFRGAPVAVVLAESTADIQETVRFATKHSITITPRGAGSGLSGGSVPVEGGIVLSLEKMRAIVQINAKDRRVVVQPGVVTSDLQIEVAKHGLFYPPDPSSYTVSTIGGNVAENAGGLRCFKYGVTSHYVLGIEYVDSNGDLKLTGTLGGGGYEPDLTSMLVGSEGTLGIFTRIELLLIPLPACTITLAAYFPSRDSALGTVEEIVAKGLVPAVLEFIDKRALSAAAEYSSISYPSDAEALLLVEADGTNDEAEATAIKVTDFLKKRALQVERAESAAERENLWKLRRSISPSLIRLASGKIHEDIAVPRGKIAELAHKVEEIGTKRGFQIPIYGHAGDGNLHVVVPYDAADEEAAKRAEETSQEIFRAAIALGGTITGEHGIGFAKRDFLPWQLSDKVLGLSRSVKRQFDPEGVFNPGKILA